VLSVPSLIERAGQSVHLPVDCQFSRSGVVISSSNKSTTTIDEPGVHSKTNVSLEIGSSLSNRRTRVAGSVACFLLKIP